MTTLLRFNSVALVRGGRLLFDDMTFALEPGAALRLVGPNGCGKSSLLRLAAGLLVAERGTVDRAPCALADDKVALDRELPLGRALGFWGGQSAVALDSIGLGALVQVPVRLLSSGQVKRAGLARVIASSARLWLLDEPLNALDQDGEQRLDEAIAAHRAGGGAVLAASHVPFSGEWATLDFGS